MKMLIFKGQGRREMVEEVQAIYYLVETNFYLRSIEKVYLNHYFCLSHYAENE